MIRYKLQWLTKSLKRYSSTMVRELYASYVATIHSTLPKRKKPLAQPRLTETKVKGWQVDISETTICRILFGLEFPTPRPIAEFDYTVEQARDFTLIRDP